MEWLNDKRSRGDDSSVWSRASEWSRNSEKLPEINTSRGKEAVGKLKTGKKIRFAAETRDDSGWTNRTTTSSDRSPKNRKGADPDSFQQALWEIDELLVRDERRTEAPTTSNRAQFELEESREMNRVLAEQLQLLNRKVLEFQRDGSQNVTEKKFLVMKNKLSAVTGILDDVTRANQALQIKNEELNSRLRKAERNTNTMDAEDREGLQSIIMTLTEKVEQQKQEKMSFLAAQARTEAKASEQKKVYDASAKQISDLNARNTELEIEVVNLKDQLQDSKEALENETKEKRKLTKQISELFEDLDDMTETSKGLMARNEKLVHQIHDLSEEENRSQEEERSLQDESQKSFMADIRARKLTLEKKVANLNSKLSDAMKQARENEDISERMEEMKRRMETQASAHQSEMAVASTEMSELKARNSTLQLEIAGLKVRLDNAHKEINVTRKANAALMEESQARDSESRRKLEYHPEEAAASQILFNDLDEHISQLERKNRRLEEEKSILQSKYESCCAEFDDVNSSNRKLATKNRELQTENRLFEKEATQCRGELDAKKAMVEALVIKVENLQEQRLELIGEKESAETKVAVEKNAMVIASTRMAELDARNASLELEVSELNDKLDEVNTENQALRKNQSDAYQNNTEKRSLLAKIEQIEVEMEALRADRSRLETEVNVHKSSLQTAAQQNSELGIRNVNLQTEIDKLKETLETAKLELTAQIDAMKTENKELLEENSSMRAVYESKTKTNEEWDTLHTKYTNCCSELDVVQEKNKELVLANDEMESQVCMQVNLINQLNHESQSKIKVLEECNREWKNKSLKLQEHCDRIESAQTELQAKYELCRSDIKTLEKRNKALGREIDQQDSQFQTLSKEIISNGMKGNDAAMTSIISALNRKVEHLQEEKKNLFDGQASIEAQATVHRNSMVVATAQVAELSAKKSALETEISELKTKLEDATKEINTAHESMSVTQNTLNSINQLNDERQTKLDSLILENAEFKKTNKALERDHDLLSASHTELVGKYESCSTELESLRNQVETLERVKRSSLAMAATQMSELSARNAALEVDIAEVNSQLETANKEIQATREAMSASVSIYAEKVDNLNHLNKEYQSKIDELETSNASLVQESRNASELRASIEEHKTSIGELKSTLETCQGQLTEANYSNEVYKGLISQLNEMNDEMKTQCKANKEEIESLKQQKAILNEHSKELVQVKERIQNLLEQKKEMDEALESMKTNLKEVTKDRDVARREETYLSLRVDELVKAKEKIEKTLKDWKRVSKGKMRQLNFTNTTLEKSNQEKAKEIERLRALITRRR
eukprot:scaffold388_cov114-Cylindrotheca_fusiformis.AAC.1